MSATPPNSRPSTPGQRPPRRQLEEEPRKQDKNYRRYAAGIERALSSFDAAKLEWPDYISFLGRLLKAIQSHPAVIDTLPHKSSVANRLSQCLRPSLPSGVHQKALEVYDTIFELIGKQSLALDLPLYLPGVSGILAFASLSLRPAFLSLLERHIVPLDGHQLRPALRCLILALLPGLEEENGEDFERTLNVMDKLKERVKADTLRRKTATQTSGDEYFWQCFFLASIGSQTRRQGALAVLARRLPRLFADNPHTMTGMQPKDVSLSPESEATVSPEPGLLIRCFVTGLEDEQLLIQRGFLDLLLTHLPLNSPVLTRRISRMDRTRLIGAATTVVARRDMSLNRRLWSWFLGPTSKNSDADEHEGPASPLSPAVDAHDATDPGSDYFSRFGAKGLTDSILDLLHMRSNEPHIRARPFRICLSLMDRSEIGSKVVPSIFQQAMSSIRDYQASASKSEVQDVLRSASSFFDGVESGIIWAQLAQIACAGLDSTTSDAGIQSLELVQFIINHFNVREEEMLANHVPMVILLLLAKLDACEREKQGPSLVLMSIPQGRTKLYELLDALIQLLPNDKVATLRPTEMIETTEEAIPQDLLVHRISSFYEPVQGGKVASKLSLPVTKVYKSLLRIAKQLLLRSLQTDTLTQSVAARAGIFTALISRLPRSQDFEFLELIEALESPLQRMQEQPVAMNTSEVIVPFQTLHAIVSIMKTIASTNQPALATSREIDARLINKLVQQLWRYLSPSNPKYHLEAVRSIWQLEDLHTCDDSVEASITLLFTQSDDMPSTSLFLLENARRFAVLWNHTNAMQGQSGKRLDTVRSKTSLAHAALPSSGISLDFQQRLYRPLFLLFDLSDENVELEGVLRTWLDRLPSVSKVFQMLVMKVQSTLGSVTEHKETTSDHSLSPQLLHGDTRLECLHYLRRLSKLLQTTSSHVWASIQESHSESRSGNSPLEEVSIMIVLAQSCLVLLESYVQSTKRPMTSVDLSLQLTGLSILQACLSSPAAAHLQSLRVEMSLIALLRNHLRSQQAEPSVQAALLDTTLASLKVHTQSSPVSGRKKSHRRLSSTETLQLASLTPTQGNYKATSSHENVSLDPLVASDLTKCIQEGLESSSSIPLLEHWIQFLIEALPLLTTTIFQSVIPLVETLCQCIRHVFQGLNASFGDQAQRDSRAPEPGLAALLNGLQVLLAMAHDRMLLEESRKTQSRTPEPAQSFFGNVVSGVFTGDVPKARASTGNTRLTVILCFQDALRICLSIWSWGAYGGMQQPPDPTCLASFAYVSQRLRNQTRRMLDRMFMVECLECLETLIVAWSHQGTSRGKSTTTPTISLLHVLDSSSPKQTMPALFNAIYSRTSPSSIEVDRTSTLTSDLTDVELAQFLVEYTESLDDDVMDEIWIDCMTFLRDVLTNPLPHSQILPLLLRFLVILAEKVDKTNFGEQRKMRKDLGDLFLRLLAATFTTRASASGPQHEVKLSNGGEVSKDDILLDQPSKRKQRHGDLAEILTILIPRLSIVLPENERLIAAVSSISTSVTAPLIHAKIFPDNVRPEWLILLQRLCDLSVAAKIWRKDLSDLFMHPRLFNMRTTLASHLTPLIKTLARTDIEKLPDLLIRINAPTSAGIMFGVGAAAARTDADKKTQLTLRRIAFLILSAEPDTAVPSLPAIDEKISELLTATTASSPSATTRAEIFMLVRALVLNSSHIHLAPLWPTITSELHRALASAMPRNPDFDLYNVPSLLQACKLLDVLVLVAPDEFQMHEWVFVTDSSEAVYRPGNWEPVALVDELAEEIASSSAAVATTPLSETAPILSRTDTNSEPAGAREEAAYKRPLLVVREGLNTAEMGKEEFVRRVLRPFFAQLSMHVYEGAYSLKGADVEEGRRALVEDLFDEGTIVG